MYQGIYVPSQLHWYTHHISPLYTAYVSSLTYRSPIQLLSVRSQDMSTATESMSRLKSSTCQAHNPYVGCQLVCLSCVSVTATPQLWRVCLPCWLHSLCVLVHQLSSLFSRYCTSTSLVRGITHFSYTEATTSGEILSLGTRPAATQAHTQPRVG